MLFILMLGKGIMDWWILAIKSILKHPMLSHEFARGKVHINGIESFWGYARIRLIEFKGMIKNTFELHLKEGGG